MDTPDLTEAELALCAAHGQTIANIAMLEEPGGASDVPKQKIVLQFSDGSELDLWSEDFRPQFHEKSWTLPSVFGDQCHTLLEHQRRHGNQGAPQ